MARSSVRLIGVLGVVLALGVAAGCTDPGAQWNSPIGAAPTTPDAASFTIAPGIDAKDVNPATPVTVLIANGTLNDVVLTATGGKPVTGEFTADKSGWTAPRLVYDTAYTLKVTGNGLDGRPYEETRSFKTLKPAEKTKPFIRAFDVEGSELNDDQSLMNGNTYGVGQIIRVHFDEAIPDKAAAERALSVVTDPPGVLGAWNWTSSKDARWRPKAYWPANTKVTVKAEVYGKNLGKGLYGQEDVISSFTIGKSKIAIADHNTKRMKIMIDGVQVKKINSKDVTLGIPISMGKGGTEKGANGVVIDFRTQSGPHIITKRFDPKRMTSASFGITDPKSPNFYDTKIYKAQRISNDGEFVHMADWNIWAHGHTNTSHGCINVGPSYIGWFWENFGAGDVVDVTNTGRKLTFGNGGDWLVSWETWQKGSALD